ncbi:MAG: O-antigen ligase family protein [Candidatus Scalindua rubra]|uniref:Lipid A core O-antigen ligase related enzyme n=1 Tax=Candidatus Scalindua brodae TaxID=237368 RepID=A0A0B0ELS5_9BACT|nr:MAG: lipid A core O-antigen ligase related enzyme [Candidatus Scalindua brodae]MBZ0110441.1 O-antigen ligase family protein [Candidatus Scalindua rubra]TWU36275.1 O-Antigen ligase [Candidatus Brocadiaceae bacterium S225]
MANGTKQIDLNLIFVLMGILLIGCVVGFVITRAMPILVLAATLGIVIFLVSFVWPPIALYLLVFSMLLSPEFGQRETQGKGFTIRMDDLLLVILSLSWFLRSAIKKEYGLFPKTPLNRGIIAYTLICFFSTIMGGIYGKINVVGLFFVLKYFEYFVVFFMVVNFIKTKEQVKIFVILLLITCAITAFMGFMQIPAGKRVTAPFEGAEGEPGTFGGYLIMMMSVSIGLFLTSENIRTKTLLTGLIILSLIVIMATESRAAWMGLPFMYLVFLVLNKKKLLLIGTVIVIVAISPFILPENVKDRFSGTFKTEKGYQAKVGGTNLALDSSASLRVMSWQGVIKDLKYHPIFGYGITGYWFIDAQYFRTLIELGILGFSIYMYLMYSIFRFILEVHRISNDSFVKGLSMGVLAGFVSLLLHSVGSNTFIIVRIMEPFWFLMGLLVVLYYAEKDEHKEIDTKSIFIQKNTACKLDESKKVSKKI